MKEEEVFSLVFSSVEYYSWIVDDEMDDSLVFSSVEYYSWIVDDEMDELKCHVETKEQGTGRGVVSLM